METKRIVSNIISQKLTNLLEEMSTNEFLEEVGDTIYKETGEEFDRDEILSICSSPVGMLTMKIVEWMKIQ